MKQTKLITLRKQLGYSQEVMAEALCMCSSNYSRKENGHLQITAHEWKKLAEFLDVSINEIFQKSITGCAGEILEDINESSCEECDMLKGIISTQLKYIQKLEEEVILLEKQNV